MHTSLPIVLPLLVIPAAGLQDTDLLGAALAAGRTTIRLGPDGPAGDGLEFLRREAEASQHILIGEMHGTAETPELAGWILGIAKQAGYSTLFVETGPLSQEMANELLAGPNGLDGFAEFLDAYFMALPFLGWKGEAALVGGALAAGWTVAGLDQEFIASGRHLLGCLEAYAPSDSARALVREHVEAELGAAERARRTNDPSAMSGAFLASPVAAFDALDAAYDGAGQEAERLLAEMRASAAIYRLWTDGSNYESNRLRVELMKRHLREHLDARLGGDWRRLRSVSKFGGGHCARGLNSNRQYDLGTHLSELAESCGSRSFHLLVVAEENTAHPGMAESGAQGAFLAPLFAAAVDADWTLLDLRPLRALAHDSGAIRDPELLDLVFAFDAVAVAPRFTPAVDLVPR